MNSQIRFETNGLRVLVVKVPEDSDSFEMSNFNYQKQEYTDTLTMIFDSKQKNGLKKGDRPHVLLPSGKWYLLGGASDLTDEQAKVLVKESFQGTYFDYRQDYYYWPTAKESFETYLENKGINPNEKHVILIEDK